LIGGFVVLFFAVRGGYDLARMQTWQAADCTVTSVGAERYASMKSQTTYYPKITYTYRFDGRDYVGNRFDAVGNFYESDAIREVLEKFPRGALFQCYVNPRNPQESVASRTVFQFSIFRYAIALAIFFGFAAMLFYASFPRAAQAE
jgi:hypothetical protein